MADARQTNASGIFARIQLDGTTRSRTYGELFDDATKISAALRAQHFGVKVSHLVPLREADLPLTPTGKVRRNELVELYRSNILRAFSPQRDTHVEGGLSPSPSRSFVGPTLEVCS